MLKTKKSKSEVQKYWGLIKIEIEKYGDLVVAISKYLEQLIKIKYIPDYADFFK